MIKLNLMTVFQPINRYYVDEVNFPYLQLHVSKPYRLRAFSTSFFTNLTQDQIIILKYTCILKKLTLPPSPCPFFLSNNLISQAHPRSRQGRN